MKATIDITEDGFKVTMPDVLTKQDIQEIILGIRDLLINYVNAQAAMRAALGLDKKS